MARPGPAGASGTGGSKASKGSTGGARGPVRGPASGAARSGRTPAIGPPRKKAAPGETGGARKVVASNRKARHDFTILDTYEAGVALRGSEVKSLRDAKVQMRDAYARVEGRELMLVGITISPYSFAHGVGAHDPDRSRKLLMHRREIDTVRERIARERLVLIPLSIYFTDGRAKVELALAQPRKQHDKRDAIAERDAQRDIDRAMAAHRKR